MSRSTSPFPTWKSKKNGERAGFEQDSVAMGSCVSLTAPEGSVSLAVVADAESCRTMTRALFAMEDGEEPGKEEQADALGEIANMTTGLLKRKWHELDGREMQLGIPLFLSGTDCFEYVRKGVKVVARKLAAPGIRAQVVMFCQTGSKCRLKMRPQP